MRIGGMTVIALLVCATAFAQQSASIPASKDNALYETVDGSLSSGVGPTLHIGTIGTSGGNRKNRALIRFDLSGIPSGATVDSVNLAINVSKVNNGTAFPADLHRVTADWGEGSSNGGTNGQGAASTTNDATWIHRFYNSTLWTIPGGDFSDTVSASVAIGSASKYVFWSTPQLLKDVNGWIENGSSNFGWIIVGNETTGKSVKVVDSREATTAANRPTLTVYYSTGTAVEEGGSVIPVRMELMQNFPNPFNPATTIAYRVSHAGLVTLTVFDLLGKECERLVHEYRSPGTYTASFQAGGLPNGVYFYRLESGSERMTKKMILAK